MLGTLRADAGGIGAAGRASNSAANQSSQHEATPQDLLRGARFRLPAYAELARWPDWVVYGRGKIPLCPERLIHADARQAKHRLGFDEAITLWNARPDRCRGVGFHLTQQGELPSGRAELVFFDFDGVRDPRTGAIDLRALALIRHLESYSEVSPSGRGVHVLCHARLPIRTTGRRIKLLRHDSATECFGLELYHFGRFTTMSGLHLSGTPDRIEARGDRVKDIFVELFGNDPNKWNDLQAPDAELDPDALCPDATFPEKVLAAMCANLRGGFREVWELPRVAARFPSLSEHDLSLASYAALCGLPNELIACLLIVNRRRRAGETDQPDKCFRHRSYLARTIGRALMRREMAQTAADASAADA